MTVGWMKMCIDISTEGSIFSSISKISHIQLIYFRTDLRSRSVHSKRANSAVIGGK